MLNRALDGDWDMNGRRRLRMERSRAVQKKGMQILDLPSARMAALALPSDGCLAETTPFKARLPSSEAAWTAKCKVLP